jgi:hypothetical protein
MPNGTTLLAPAPVEKRRALGFLPYLLLTAAGVWLVVKIFGQAGGKGGQMRAKGLPVGLSKWRDNIRRAAADVGIPEWVLATFVKLESGGNPSAYNPEAGAMRRWADLITGDSRWKSNPDYHNVVQALAQLKAGVTAQQLAAQSKSTSPFSSWAWKFGSFGLGQMSSVTARDMGYPHSASNEGLFDPDTNLKYVAKLISKLANHKNIIAALGHRPSSKEDWSVVRAAYVGGPGGVGSSGVRSDLVANQQKFLSAAVV